jgi:hypothetical protein
MTAQIAETLIHEGRRLSMCSQPLDDYFALGGWRPTFAFSCTALWRGYVGTWEIVGERLYLIDLKGTLEEGGEAGLETLFPGFPDRVFAHWYSKTLRLPEGRLLEYVHMGYDSTYERDRLLRFERGVLVASELRENGVADAEEARQGYGIAGMMVFPARGDDKGGKR